jgi:hypothetical protein
MADDEPFIMTPHDRPITGPGDQPPPLTPEDERILDRLWDEIAAEERARAAKTRPGGRRGSGSTKARPGRKPR